MRDGARQLVLDLPVEPRIEAEDFLVGPANAAAFGFVERWPAWPDRLAALSGPPGSGKTHLAAIWAGRSAATIVSAEAVRTERVPELARSGAIVVEDLDRAGRDERALFHLLNLVREREGYALITSVSPVESCGIRTPDLLSRLRLAPALRLAEPDDAFLRALLVKLFHDRQLAVDANVVEYLAVRIERSAARAASVVAELDREALRQGRRVTRRMAAALLPDAAGQDPEETS
jgi:chromosomal replication initiation ATPase DnaA